MEVFLISALVLGLLSSLHCLGMCGPLVIGILPQDSTSSQKTGILLLYHAGRLMVYGILGILAGYVGRTLFLANLQQSLSVALGIVILFWALSRYFNPFKTLQPNFVRASLNKMMGRFLTITNHSRYFLLGGLNGLLPCGMVYIALAGAFSMDSLKDSFWFMVLFGMGTLPLLVVVSGIGLYLKTRTKKVIDRLQPALLVIFAGLMIVRGLNLGVPYLSPKILKNAESTEMECCRKK